MPNAKDYQPDAKIVALFISRSKDGKSAAAVSFPDPYHQFDFDGRFDGVAGALKCHGGFVDKDPEKVTYSRLYTKRGYEPFENEITSLEQKYASSGRFPYGTIEIASATNLVQALINSSHKLQKGHMVGNLRLSGPGDFNFEVTGMKQVMDSLHTLPCHVIMSAHIIDKYGKAPGADTYSQNIVIGEKLALRDQPGEVLLSCFSNVFRFSREVNRNSEMRYYVDFASDVAGNAFGIPPGRFDITNKAFYPFLQEAIRRVKDGTIREIMAKTEVLNLFGPT